MDISNKALIKDKCYINGNWIDSNNKDIMTFGDNLDVPAFMRNKNS